MTMTDEQGLSNRDQIQRVASALIAIPVIQEGPDRHPYFDQALASLLKMIDRAIAEEPLPQGPDELWHPAR